MDINKYYEQIVDLVRSMTPAARVTAILLLGVIVASLGFLFRFQAVTSDDYLLGGRPFSSGEITAVQRALSTAKLNDWEIEGNRIKIPSGKKALYIAALAENNALPADFFGYMDKAVESENPFTSRHALDMRLKAAKQKELALVISRFRNVDQASVMFDEIERDGLRRIKLKTASVAVQTSGGGLEAEQVKAIRNLLAASYAGLERENISITDTTTGITHLKPTENGEGGENLYAAAKADYEKEWRSKIHDVLAMIPGVIIGVNVELNPETQSDSTKVSIDTKPSVTRSTETTKESSSQAPEIGGRPGAIPNGAAAVGNQPAEVAVAAQGAKSTTSESKSDQQSVAGHEQTVIRKAPLVPSRVTATIRIPSSYYVNIWRRTNETDGKPPAGPPDAAELKRIETQEKEAIENSIVKLLPSPPLGKEPYPLVTVSSFTDLPLAPPTAETTFDQAMTWFASNWRTVGMFFLAGIGLMMLRSMIRSAAPPAPARATTANADAEVDAHGAPIPAGANAASGAGGETDDDTPRILKLKRQMSSKGPNLREELRQLVKEDPDSAAVVLRGWIGDAA